MANIIRLGSLYLNDCPAEIGLAYKPGKTISIGETAPGKEIHWVVVNDMLIADRCILTEVSWDDLNAQNLVFGKEVTISGFRFTARLIQVGAEEGAPNEWDSALDTVGEDNSLWHWEDMFFWGQEAATGTASSRAYRGYTSARTFYCTSSSRRSVSLGFRPALVPLASDTLWPSSKAMWWLSEKVMWRGNLGQRLIQLVQNDTQAVCISLRQASMWGTENLKEVIPLWLNIKSVSRRLAMLGWTYPGSRMWTTWMVWSW